MSSTHLPSGQSVSTWQSPCADPPLLLDDADELDELALVLDEPVPVLLLELVVLPLPPAPPLDDDVLVPVLLELLLDEVVPPPPAPPVPGLAEPPPQAERTERRRKPQARCRME